MNHQLETTLSKIVSSQEHMEAFNKCTTPQEAYDYALTHGSGFTLEEFITTTTALNKVIMRQAAKEGKLEEVKSAVKASTNPYVQNEIQGILDALDAEGFGELTDDDLLMVAGGISDELAIGLGAGGLLAGGVGMGVAFFCFMM